MEKKVAFKNPTCMLCGTDLVLMQVEEDSGKREYKCPYCGTVHIFYPCNEEEQEDYAYYNDEIKDNFIERAFDYGMNCPQCGCTTIRESDFMQSDMFQDVEDDDDSIVSIVSCPHCGASIEIIEAKPSELKDYPAFQKKENKEENYF